MSGPYGTIFDHMLEGCQVISPFFRYIYVNRAAALQGRMSKNELIGKKMQDCYPGIEKTKMFEHIKTCMQTRRVQKLENEFTFPDGTKGWFELRMEPVPEGVLVLSINITERKKAEQHLTELDELKSTFIKLVSHQLRTPLATMRWGLEDVIDNKSSNPAEELQAVYSATVQIIDRLNDMITTLDIAENKVAFIKKPAVFADLWEPVYKDVKARAVEQKIKLTVRNDAPGVKLVCDGDKIQTVLKKLLDNSLNYTHAGGAISVNVAQKDQTLRVTIKDTGIGIPLAEQSRIFTRFFRAQNAMLANTKSSGVGLVICKYYVEQHGGQIGFVSDGRKGTTFWFEVPCSG